MLGQKSRKGLNKALRAIFVAAVIMGNLFPVYWLVSTSLKAPDDQFSIPPKWIFVPTFEHYDKVLLNPKSRFLNYFGNSLIVGVSSTLLVLAIGIPCAYSIGCLPLKRKRDVAFYLLTLRFGAPIGLLIPVFVLFRQVQLLNTYYGLILLYTIMNLPIVVWMMKGFFQEIPAAILEAARLDGCSDFYTMVRIAIPMVFAGIIASAILSLIFSWNEFFFAVSLTGEATKTAPVAIYGYISVHQVDWGSLCASGMLTTLPVLIFALIVQKYVIKGLTFGAIKG